MPPDVPNTVKTVTVLKLTRGKENWLKISFLTCDAVHSNLGLLVTSRKSVPDCTASYSRRRCGCVCMCGCFGNMYPCIYCVLYCLCCVFCIVLFMYIYCFCLYMCKDYCHRVKTQLQFVTIIIIIIISTSDPDSNIIYGSNSKATTTKSNKT